jgi:ABC-type sulfate transport system permease component
LSVKNHLVSRDRIQIGVMLAPAVLIVLLLFGGGLVLALAASGGPSSYRRLATDREFLASSIFTLWVASASTAISAVLGLLLGANLLLGL